MRHLEVRQGQLSGSVLDNIEHLLSRGRHDRFSPLPDGVPAALPGSGRLRQIPVRGTLPEGFVCRACGKAKAWELQTKPWTWECAACGKQTSVTAGTIMHHSKLSLTIWFWAAYLMATHSNGISAWQLQRQLALGSYKTAWLICAKLRRSMWRLTAARSPVWSRSMRPRSPAAARTILLL